MRLLVALITVVAATTCLAFEQPQQQPHNQQHNQPSVAASSQQQQASANKQQAAPLSLSSNDRQGRSIASGGAGNLLQSGNSIDHSLGTSKARIETERRQVQEFLTTKNIFKQIMKLLFGNQEEINATSRNVLGMLSKVLDILKNSFGTRSRSGSGARTIKDTAEDVGSSAVSMLQGYVKSVLTKDGQCAKRYLCQASREAIRDGRELGYIVATVGGYATSYLLESNSKDNVHNNFYDATVKGRQNKEDCATLFAECTEQ